MRRHLLVLLCIVKARTGALDCFEPPLGRIEAAMSTFRPPGRGNDPLGALLMAAALVAAAVVGAALGFAIDFFSGGSSHSQSGTKAD